MGDEGAARGPGRKQAEADTGAACEPDDSAMLANFLTDQVFLRAAMECRRQIRHGIAKTIVAKREMRIRVPRPA